MSQDCDVLIIGAGPTGLTLACELQARGLKIRIIDKLDKPTDQSRALGIHARSLQIFEKLGILEKVLDFGLPVDTVHFYDQGNPVGQIDFKPAEIEFPFVLIIPQATLEQILSERLSELGGHVERGVSLVDVQGNKAIVTNGEITARWIVGCDGAHSALRRSLKLPFKGTKYSETFVLADVKLKDFPLSPKDIHAFLTPQSILGMIPFKEKNLYRLVTIFPRPINPDILTIDFLEKLLQNQTKQPISIDSIIWTAPFSVHRRIVPTMMKESTFLCGDAAHIHSPAGGQGLNIGIQDAFNLAWKLDLVCKGFAKEKLLKTYNNERLPIAKHILWGTSLATFFISIPYHFLRHIAFKGFMKFLRFPSLRKRFVETLAEVRTCYPSKHFSFFWKGPKPGSLAPMLETDPERRFIVLVFGAPDFQPELNDNLFTLRHIPLDSPMATLYKATKPCVYVIRPDGYIAYRTRDLPSFLRRGIGYEIISDMQR